MTLFDSHAHYCDGQYDGDRERLLAAMPDAGLVGILNVPSDLEEAARCIALAAGYPFMWAAAGVHPQLADGWTGESEAQLRRLLTLPKCVALGEIGLDYVVGEVPKDIQKAVFLQQLKIAREMDKPVIIHDREAHGDTFDMLKNSGCRGVLHCYSGGAELACELVKLGWYISFAGVVTFKNAKKSREVVQAVPSEKLLIETDSPYLAPEPYRGTRNDSRLVRYTCEAVAALLGMAPEALGALTADNARQCFSL
ncbi:MAG TPA: TatD family hydrolase [Terriglobales bacterium]|nr:TatD family hydrolase [Terriglobales bacterium]